MNFIKHARVYQVTKSTCSGQVCLHHDSPSPGLHIDVQQVSDHIATPRPLAAFIENLRQFPGRAHPPFLLSRTISRGKCIRSLRRVRLLALSPIERVGTVGVVVAAGRRPLSLRIPTTSNEVPLGGIRPQFFSTTSTKLRVTQRKS